MQPGEQIQVKAYKADGTCYRWWPATVETVTEELIVTIAPIGKRVEGVGVVGFQTRLSVPFTGSPSHIAC